MGTSSSFERRLLRLVGAVVFLDTLFYAAIAPLLPNLAHQLHLSKLSAGVMTGCYPAGTLIGSIPGGLLAVRAGPRQTMCAGLMLLACSTVAFGIVSSTAGLDAARFVEGLGGACSWSGGIAWLVAETPVGRRGATMGRAVGAAVGGSLFGPVIGTVASGIGRPAVFSAIAVVALLLIAATRRLPVHLVPSRQGIGTILRALGHPSVLAAMWLVALPAVVSGMLNVLAPLRLHRFGAPAAAVGAAFLLASVMEAFISPLVGALSDRRGRLVPLRFGLAAAAVLMVCFAVPSDAVLLGGLVALSAAALGMFWAPAMAMLSDAAEAHGLDQGLAAALINLAWAGGQILGSSGGGGLARGAGDGLATLLGAALCGVTLAASTLVNRRVLSDRFSPSGLG